MGAAGSAYRGWKEFLAGEEASFIVMADGRRALALASQPGPQAPARRRRAARIPAAWVFIRRPPLVTPGVACARAAGGDPASSSRAWSRTARRIRDFSYAGLMITEGNGVKVLRVQLPPGRPGNAAHLAAPEKRPRRADRAGPRRSASTGSKPNGTRGSPWAWCLASAGYPDAPRKGDVIPRAAVPGLRGLLHVFHAATASSGGEIVTNGGRVLTVTALGHNVRTAQRRASTRSRDGFSSTACSSAATSDIGR